MTESAAETPGQNPPRHGNRQRRSRRRRRPVGDLCVFLSTPSGYAAAAAEALRAQSTATRLTHNTEHGEVDPKRKRSESSSEQ